jgi:hypothetical protein
LRGLVEDNAAVEVHDSTLERIEQCGDDLLAVLSAYVHHSPGRPGIDAGTGWVQTLHLTFRRGRATGDLHNLPMELLDGNIEVSGERFSNVIPIPLDRTGPAKIEFFGWNETQVILEGEGVNAALIGNARYVEDFSASEDATR